VKTLGTHPPNYPPDLSFFSYKKIYIHIYDFFFYPKKNVLYNMDINHQSYKVSRLELDSNGLKGVLPSYLTQIEAAAEAAAAAAAEAAAAEASAGLKSLKKGGGGNTVNSSSNSSAASSGGGTGLLLPRFILFLLPTFHLPLFLLSFSLHFSSP
jgi:hypothetical protein